MGGVAEPTELNQQSTMDAWMCFPAPAEPGNTYHNTKCWMLNHLFLNFSPNGMKHAGSTYTNV